MNGDGEARFREPKTVYEERELVEKLFPRQPNKQFLANGKFLGRLSLPF